LSKQWVVVNDDEEDPPKWRRGGGRICKYLVGPLAGKGHGGVVGV